MGKVHSRRPYPSNPRLPVGNFARRRSPRLAYTAGAAGAPRVRMASTSPRTPHPAFKRRKSAGTRARIATPAHGSRNRPTRSSQKHSVRGPFRGFESIRRSRQRPNPTATHKTAWCTHCTPPRRNVLFRVHIGAAPVPLFLGLRFVVCLFLLGQLDDDWTAPTAYHLSARSGGGRWPDITIRADCHRHT